MQRFDDIVEHWLAQARIDTQPQHLVHHESAFSIEETRELFFKLRREASRSQPEIERQIHQGLDLAGIEDFAGNWYGFSPG